MRKPVLISFFAFVTATLFCSASFASSPAAWSAHDQEVAATCLKASGLKNARVAGAPMVFDDRTAKTVLVISGRYPQPHMKNRAGRELCLFDRKTREAFVTEADQITVAAPPRRP
ncbi:MAG: hypothetical protein EOO28_08785 [Comamonadaceae bacterium]|nr:MAG: hypothetical protein EOO28_08785 [Comamonadaceae bacterium]